MTEPKKERVVTMEIRAVDTDGKLELWSTAHFAVRGMDADAVRDCILDAVHSLDDGSDVVVLRLPDRAHMPGRSQLMSEVGHAYSLLQSPSYHMVQALERAREEWAETEGRTPQSLLNTPVLQSIARSMPENMDALLAIRGVGSLTVSKYGAQILEIVAAHRPKPDPAPEKYNVDQ